MEKLNAVLRC